MTSLYRTESSNPKENAQRNLQGRTHYCDNDSLRFHYSRILQSDAYQGGLLFGIVESVALDMHNSKRGYRAVVFDVFGSVISRKTLSECRKSKASAVRDLEKALQEIDAKSHTLQAIQKAKETSQADLGYIQSVAQAA